MENSADSFEFVFFLVKTLSSSCRTTRQSSERIEHLVRRVAKLSHASYEDLSREPSEELRERYDALAVETEEERLLRENFSLIYEIEMQEFICERIWSLVDQIEELLRSIKRFALEQKAHRTQKERSFIESVLKQRISGLETSTKTLQTTATVSRNKVESLVNSLKDFTKDIDWDLLAQSQDGRNVLTILDAVEYQYKLKLKNN
ncbi:LAMI_0E01288g1_1 [Lachancea mirantina]|uniref:LAMI_0E01288g1_1 n=1 Tax=Lachancea mirantina TaxID=1230905 RepID=A0A1G4JII0_9SACH|nr:LAMI_0E01288g1_1 [Lachancea mirantina]